MTLSAGVTVEIGFPEELHKSESKAVPRKRVECAPRGWEARSDAGAGLAWGHVSGDGSPASLRGWPGASLRRFPRAPGVRGPQDGASHFRGPERLVAAGGSESHRPSLPPEGAAGNPRGPCAPLPAPRTPLRALSPPLYPNPRGPAVSTGSQCPVGVWVQGVRVGGAQEGGGPHPHIGFCRRLTRCRRPRVTE